MGGVAAVIMKGTKHSEKKNPSKWIAMSPYKAN